MKSLALIFLLVMLSGCSVTCGIKPTQTDDNKMPTIDNIVEFMRLKCINQF
jgi:hypothetical protein